MRFNLIMERLPGLGVLIFAAVVACATAQGPPWPWGQPIIHDYIDCVEINGAYHHEFADESECTHFYECNWNDGIRHSCPRDNLTPNWNGYLVYNPTTEVCDRLNSAIIGGAIC